MDAASGSVQRIEGDNLQEKRSRKEQRRDRQQHYEELESRHDAKALERFKRPAYQSVSVAEYLALGNEKDDLSPDRPFITLTVGELIVKMSHPKSSFLSLLDVIIIPQMLLTFTDIFFRKPKIYQCLPVKSIDLPF